MKNLKKIKSLMIIISVLTIISGCTYNYDNKTCKKKFSKSWGNDETELIKETKVISLDNVEKVNTKIIMSAGKLLIKEDSVSLLKAAFAYNNEDWKPRVRYEVIDSLGVLKILPAKIPKTDDDEEHINIKNVWDIHLSNKVPMDLSLKFGAGDGDLYLGNLLLENLDIKLGAGSVLVDLKNSRKLSELNLKMGVGETTIDLSGDISTDLDASIEGGIGQFTLILPKNIGTKVSVKRGIAKIEADDFIKKGNTYKNDVYGDTEVTLNIHIRAGIGNVDLKLE
ncbi:MAG: hypothetical protein KAT68_14910 [Bacteroidales bacterium]|nr:hypothetical protein [Bacteroidales bacterium]